MSKQLKGEPLETLIFFIFEKIFKKRKLRILKRSFSSEKLERGDQLGSYETSVC